MHHKFIITIVFIYIHFIILVFIMRIIIHYNTQKWHDLELENRELQGIIQSLSKNTRY